MSLEFNLISSDKYCTYITDGTHGTHINQESGKYLLSAKDILDGVVHIKENSRVISEEDFNKIHKNYKLENYDVLLTVAGTIGRTAIIRNYKNNYTFQRSVAIFKTNDKLKSLWLYYYLNSPIGKQIVKSLSKGTTQLILPLKDLRNLEIPVPKNIEDQKKILSILVNIDKKIEVNKKINKNLEDQLSLIFDDMFIKCSNYDEESLVKTDWEKIPKEWENIDFGDIIKITSGDRPDEKSEIKTSEFNIPLFGASKIMGYTKEFSYNEDILIIGRVGTHGVIQRVNYPCFPSDNTFVIKSEYYGFVYQLLKRIDYDSLNTGSTQPLITQKSLKTVNVVLPDKNSLFSFEKISKTIFDKIYINQNEISILQKLRDTLLPKLMSGEIDVSEINCDLKIIIRKIYIKSSKLFLWRYLSENKNYIKNTKSNETLLKSRTIYKINKFLAKFNARYRYYRQ